MSDFVAGDVVQLKSGGPRMTVDNIGDYSPMGVAGKSQAKCTWFDDKHKLQSDVFELHALEKYERPSGGLRVRPV